jgi:hypothetical protein
LKYNIKKISNKNEIENVYSNFIKFSSQKNIFCSKEILEFFFNDLDLYTINKNDKIKSFVYLLKDKDNFIISEPFIYSGIINHPKLNMKNSRYNNEVFKINELIINEIFNNYENINLNLSPNFLDTRPFLWFNYEKHDKKKFLVTPRYTSIIDIQSKKSIDVFNEIDDVKRRDINKVLKDKNYKVENQINLPLIKRFYEDTMKKNKGNFNNYAFNRIFDFMETQINRDKIIQITVYYFEKPLYSVLFLNDDNTSCYLYGSGDVEIKNRYAGSLALWKAIEQSLDKKLSFIDLEGINSPHRGEYKLNFGGNIKDYYNICL